MGDPIRRKRDYADALCTEADEHFARGSDAAGEKLMADAQRLYEEIERESRRQRSFSDCPHC